MRCGSERQRLDRRAPTRYARGARDDCPFITLPPYRRTAVPPYRRTAVPPYRRTAVPPYRPSALPPYHPISSKL